MTSTSKRTVKDKVELFMSLFQGLPDAYGTYNIETGKHWRVKENVTEKVILDHLKGKQSYGFYPLMGVKSRVGVVDFDSMNSEPPLKFIRKANHYGIDAYLERSKSKGYHVWIFFKKEGVIASKVRLVIKFNLDEIGSPQTEIFPKQNKLNGHGYYGNFINAPLFGKLVQKGRTVFINPDLSLKPYPDQWTFLESVKRVKEEVLDSIIDVNNLCEVNANIYQNRAPSTNHKIYLGLPICIRRILEEGVTFDQRVVCFRLAVHLKRIGFPADLTIATLKKWRFKNRPLENKRIITTDEILEQVNWAYKKLYTGFGCQEPVIKYFCTQ
ncbi:hypothetical protein ACFLS9_09095, partial [Bacteroidota bacterium]